MSPQVEKALEVVIKGPVTEPLCRWSFGSIALRKRLIIAIKGELYPGMSQHQSPRKDMFPFLILPNL